jgi:hypothetical protein
MDGDRDTPIVELHRSTALKLRITRIIMKLHTADTLVGL